MRDLFGVIEARALVVLVVVGLRRRDHHDDEDPDPHFYGKSNKNQTKSLFLLFSHF
jgi:hypothetical protein